MRAKPNIVVIAASHQERWSVSKYLLQAPYFSIFDTCNTDPRNTNPTMHQSEMSRSIVLEFLKLKDSTYFLQKQIAKIHSVCN